MTNTPTAELAPRTRLHGFDSLRAWAMLLGVLLHVVLAFMPGVNVFIGWPIVDQTPTPSAGLLVVAIHAFRMPLFFFVSGVLTALSFNSRGPGPALRSRLVRIGLPFLIGLVTVVPAVRLAATFALTHGGFLDGQPTWTMFVQGLRNDSWLTLLSPAHLWFLQYLLIYVLAAAAGFAIFAKPTGQSTPTAKWSTLPALAAHLVGIGLVLVFMFLMKGTGIDTPTTIIPMWHVVAYYGVFFAGGCVVAVKARSLATLIPLPPLMALGGLAVTIFFSIAAVIAESIARGDTGEPVPGATAFIKPLSLLSQPFLWLSIIGFVAWAARPRKPLTGLVDRIFRGSYWTYLVHLPLAWVLHALLRNVGGNTAAGGWLRFALVLGLTMIVCQVSYELLIARTPLAKFLDMRPKRSAATTAPEPAFAQPSAR